MPKFPVNLADANNDPIPEGTYFLLVSEVEEKTSQTGKDFLSWKLEVVYDIDMNDTYAGRVVFYNTFLTPKALFVLRNLVKAVLETNGEDTQQIDDPDFVLDTDEMLDSIVQAKIGITEPNEKGRIYNEILSLEGAPDIPMV